MGENPYFGLKVAPVLTARISHDDRQIRHTQKRKPALARRQRNRSRPSSKVQHMHVYQASVEGGASDVQTAVCGVLCFALVVAVSVAVAKAMGCRQQRN